MDNSSQGSDEDICRNTQEDATQDYNDNDGGTMHVPSPTKSDEVKPRSNIWGSLRRKGGDQEEVKLEHRTKDGRRDTYIIGRSKAADVIVEDKRVSSQHCFVYCDYEEARLRVFVEDKSVNGTYVNDSLTRLHKGKRLELKTGDEIFLINPHNLEFQNGNTTKCASFLYINLRDRLFVQRTIGSVKVSENLSTENSSLTHVEDFYVIGDQLGSGMCGQVHRCINRLTGEHCAVKIIDAKKFAMTPGLSPSELREEAEMMRKLDHPNIIKIKDTYETDHVIFIVMELVSGGDLFDRIVSKGRYSEDAARDVMKKLLSAVSYLHTNNIIHRDLKPENILLVSNGNDTDVILTDFGLAKQANQDGLKTFCGTPQYFAPEVLKRKSTIAGAGRYGTSADMWSLGVVLYILLSGAFPFLDDENLFHQIQNAQYSVTGPEWSTISDSAKHMVKSLLTLRPDQRISVDQAIQHPWILGSSVISRIPAGKRTSLSNSGISPRLKNVESATKHKSQKQKPKVTLSGPQLELVISNRPIFGSCSWTHRGFILFYLLLFSLYSPLLSFFLISFSTYAFLATYVWR
jgi:serine/threonine protein kinase